MGLEAVPSNPSYLKPSSLASIRDQNNPKHFNTTAKRLTISISLKQSSQVQLCSDSVYVGKGLLEWMPKWKANGWKRREGKTLKPVINEDLWKQLDALLSKHKVTFQHVRGHSGHPENERCDQLAVAAYQHLL